MTQPDAPGQGVPERPRMPGMAEYLADAVTEVRLFESAVALRVGPFTVRYRAESPELRLRLSGPRLDFVVESSSPPDVDVRCSLGDVAPAAGPPIFAADDAWEARALPDGGQEICYFDFSLRGRAPWARTRHDGAIAVAEASLRPRSADDRVMPVGFPTDEYFIARRLARASGLLLHASSLVVDGGAYLFVGHSGAGKSTTAMNAASVGAEVLSDDRTIVTAEPDGSFRAWGTPWHGSFRRATNASAPVRGLFVLLQAGHDRVVAISPARAVGETFVRLVHPTPDEDEVRLTIDTLEGLVTTIPVGELHQRPTPAGFELARRFVAG